MCSLFTLMVWLLFWFEIFQRIEWMERIERKKYENKHYWIWTYIYGICLYQQNFGVYVFECIQIVCVEWVNEMCTMVKVQAMDMDTHIKSEYSADDSMLPHTNNLISHTNKWQSIGFPLTQFFVLQISRVWWFKQCFTFNCGIKD